MLEALECKLSILMVCWFSDNQNVVRIILVGRRNVKLQEEAVKVFEISLKYSIKIDPEWVPREHNQVADYLSRMMDYDDWGISPKVFEEEIDNAWGPHTVDRFASDYNAKLCRFNSRFWNPGSEAMDAFTVDWSHESNYFWPPVHLVARVLHHACTSM